jgi:hypothetical protein
VRVLFTDKDGFALEDHTAPKIPALFPGKTIIHKATAEMSPDLAQRVARALATVSAATK